MNNGSIVHLETRDSAHACAQMDALLRIDIRSGTKQILQICTKSLNRYSFEGMEPSSIS